MNFQHAVRIENYMTTERWRPLSVLVFLQSGGYRLGTDQGPGSSALDLGPWIQGPGSKALDQMPWILGLGSKTLDPWIQCLGSNTAATAVPRKSLGSKALDLLAAVTAVGPRGSKALDPLAVATAVLEVLER